MFAIRSCERWGSLMNSSHSVIVTCGGGAVSKIRERPIFLIYDSFLRTTAVPFTGHQQRAMLICINYNPLLRNQRRRRRPAYRRTIWKFLSPRLRSLAFPSSSGVSCEISNISIFGCRSICSICYSMNSNSRSILRKCCIFDVTCFIIPSCVEEYWINTSSHKQKGLLDCRN